MDGIVYNLWFIKFKLLKVPINMVAISSYLKLWFLQYSCNINFHGFHGVDAWNYEYWIIEIQFLITKCIDNIIGHTFTYPWNHHFYEIHEIDAHVYWWNHSINAKSWWIFFPFSSLVIYIPVSHAHQYCHSRCDHDGSFLWDLLPDCANHGSFRDRVTPGPGHCCDILSVRLFVQSVFGKLDATNQLLFAMTFIMWLAMSWYIMTNFGDQAYMYVDNLEQIIFFF